MSLFSDKPLNPEIDESNLFEEAKLELETQKASSLEDEKRHLAQQAAQWGPYLKDVPFEVAYPSQLEALAWHAPGILGAMVRDAAPYMDRPTLIPALAAALVTLCRLQQGKVVSEWSGHITPTALMIWAVGESGSGKGEACGLIDQWLAIADHRQLHGTTMRDFKSGPGALSNFAEHGSIMLTQEEAGALMVAQKGDGHGATALVAMTEIFTAFSRGLGSRGAAKISDNTKEVSNPCLSALFCTTPGKFDAALQGADVESGWLGRWLAIKFPKPRRRKREGVYVPSEALREQLQALADRIPMGGDLTWTGKSTVPFLKFRYDDEGAQKLWHNSEQMEDICEDPDENPLKKHIASRANEAVNRVATVVGASDPNARSISVKVVDWAIVFVEESLANMSSLIAGKGEVADGDSPGARARAAIYRLFARAKEDPQVLRELGGRHDGDGVVMLQRRQVQQAAKKGLDSGVVTRELAAMEEEGVLFRIRPPGVHHNHKGFLKLLP